MGQAKRRGTREERIAQAVERDEAANLSRLRYEADHPKPAPSTKTLAVLATLSAMLPTR